MCYSCYSNLMHQRSLDEATMASASSASSATPYLTTMPFMFPSDNQFVSIPHAIPVQTSQPTQPASSQRHDVQASSELTASNRTHHPRAPSSTIDAANAATKRRVTISPSITVHPLPHASSTMSFEYKSQLYYTVDELTQFNLEVKSVRRALMKKYGNDGDDEHFGSDTDNVDDTPSDGIITSSSRSSSWESSSRNYFSKAVNVLNCNDESLRGLEFCICRERVRNRALAKRAILKYYRHLYNSASSSGRDSGGGSLDNSTNDEGRSMSQEQKDLCLAVASSKFTRWSYLIALETARLDSLRAYEEEDNDEESFASDYNGRCRRRQEPFEITPFPDFLQKKRRRVTLDDENESNGR